jgi:ubiquinone biosynthesis protein UbiJ
MNNTSPFSFLESMATRFQLPEWVVSETQQRLVLFLNHVLMQEKEAQDRLARKKGSVLHIRWGLFELDLLITPAGLLDKAPPAAKPDLLIAVAVDSPMVLMQSVMAGKSPPVKIEGDVQLAAELGWLAENLRWDFEEDLSRVVGDIPAHAMADAARRVAQAVKSFLVSVPGSPFKAAGDTQVKAAS